MSTLESCEKVNQASREGGSPMYGQIELHTALARSPSKYSSRTSPTVALRYLKKTGNCSTIESRFLSETDIDRCDASWKNRRCSSKNARTASASCGRASTCASTISSCPNGTFSERSGKLVR